MRIIKLCVVDKKPFYTSPSSRKITCSRKCSRIHEVEGRKKFRETQAQREKQRKYREKLNK